MLDVKEFKKAILLRSKAIHLEVIADPSSQPFIAAFWRFTLRRVECFKLYSDNGTNFVGPMKILKDEMRQEEWGLSDIFILPWLHTLEDYGKLEWNP